MAPVEPQELGPLEWERDPPLAIDERETIDAVGEQSCEIRLWRGYVKCQLYVELEGVPGALAESPLFRLRNPLTPDDRARRELSQLLAGLERQGWTVVETGPVWYRRRLERRESPSR